MPLKKPRKTSHAARLRSQELRAQSTEWERKLWTQLRHLRKQGFHFRRQVPIGKYFADFACLKKRMVVELDGGHHDNPLVLAYDLERELALKALGYTILRFRNADVRDNLDAVVTAITSFSPPTPTHPRTAQLPRQCDR
ncbi:MAG TPA: endonuclease domain-containing protein [Micropepsaceae bacterium]|nr:endonuclease domain-containing protein [Micropepsaceae bacterium]